MYTKSISLALFLLAFTSAAFANIWIVDNNPFPAGDYTTLAAAHSVASPGDTIYVYPSATAYAGITVTKRLSFIGAGFDLEIYGGQATTANTTISGTMKFNAGSEGSVLEGFDGVFKVDINTDNITIKRNELSKVEIGGSNCYILQNEIVASLNFQASIWVTAGGLGNIIIANNKIRNTSYGDDGILSNSTSQLVVVNNVIRASDDALSGFSSTSLIQNNIITGGGIGQNGNYQYNMCNADQLPNGGVGNIENIDMTIVFEDPSNFNTGLHLLPGSPAIGAGFGGTDMGIYGGDTPFIDGGYPGLPAVFQIEAQVITIPQNGLEVNFQAKSNAQ